MIRLMAGLLAAVLLVAATASPADAQWRGRGYYGWYGPRWGWRGYWGPRWYGYPGYWGPRYYPPPVYAPPPPPVYVPPPYYPYGR
jgi:hypothetical protein